MSAFAITNARIFDGTDFLDGKSVIVRDGNVDKIVDAAALTISPRSMACAPSCKRIANMAQPPCCQP